MDFYIGTILPWAGAWAPQGWTFCQGQTLQVNQNQALFAVIGARYGGNGSTTFCLPNLQGRVPVGAGIVPGTVTNFVQGTYGGATSVNLTPQAMPQHTHSASVTNVNVSADFGLRVSTNKATSLLPPSDATSANFGLAAVDSEGTGTDVNIYKDISGDGTSVVKLKSYPCDVTSSGGTVTVNPAGSATPQAVSLLQPYQVVNYIICLQGIFPVRD